MRKLKLTATLFAALAVGALAASSASADFGIADFDGATTANPAGDAFTQAGGHPYAARTIFDVNAHVDDEGRISPDGGGVKDIEVELPLGLIGNPASIPTCSSADFVIVTSGQDPNTCPTDSQVGVATPSLDFGLPFGIPLGPLPVYNLKPTYGSVAVFGFKVFNEVVFLQAVVRPEDDGVTVKVRNTSEAARLIGTSVALWGNPADESHDPERWCQIPGGLGCATNQSDVAFLTNPTACTAPGTGLVTTMRANSWDDQEHYVEKSFESHLPPGFTDFFAPLPPNEWGAPQGPDGCDAVPFNPSITVTPTTTQADSPTGLNVDISVPSDGLLNPTGISQSHLKKAVVTLPEGMSVNPSSASGLGACSSQQLAGETVTSAPGEGCPNDSKIGTVRIDTPLLDDPVSGSVYLAKQHDNQFDSLLALYIVVKEPAKGILITLPGEVSPNPQTGQLETTFDQNPQLPFSNLHLELKGGPRAPLITPRTCGSYSTEAELSPWSGNPPAELDSLFQIASGPEGKACPGAADFAPAFEAGTTTPIAGAYSPLVVNASRPDGSQSLQGLSLTLPKGLTGKLAGVQACSDAALKAAEGKSGAAELASPSCPATSKVGTVDVAAGAGSTPFHVTGTAYLAGPYKGAPLSLAVITPAVAGPFDLGTVVVRAAAQIDPLTTQIKVTSDPIPSILQGIPLKVRSVSVNTDRPEFTLNPTSCDPMSLDGTLFGSSASKAVSNRFQVGACKALSFSPKLALSLKGPTHRRAHPALKAVLTAKPGEANIARAQVRLPKAAFIDNAHIGTPCTRPAFATHSCPEASKVGKVSATTPILDYTLKGSVYLRANPAHKLPDLVADLRGPDSQPIEIELAGKTDAVKGALRNTFEAVPDAPVTKFTLELFGGKKGLIELSSGLCAHPKASVKLDAQSGATYDTQPKVKASCGG